MSNRVDPIKGAQCTYEPGDKTPRPKTNRTVDHSRTTGTDFDLQDLPMRGDDDVEFDLDLDQEDPMSAQCTDLVKQIGMRGGAFSHD
ncbi:uncharacterized protein N7477_005294 [Penicillium maclennaniae]|uniref:uncharacterized protein n=1 Tax=Penicillium maclennaniae TaxID=1343394 RepID=UPI00253F7F4F|nr:uncharacterized protein N7477_005294 [Penicillium maclennaniae]KAJ5669931.1 hypothetical protein N7477_005294 [Penicillium maclennaniae]